MEPDPEEMFWRMREHIASLHVVLGALVRRNGGEPVLLSEQEMAAVHGTVLHAMLQTDGGMILWTADGPHQSHLAG